LKRTAQERKVVVKRNTENGRYAVCVKKRWETTGQNEIGKVVKWHINGYNIIFVKTDKGYFKLAHQNWIKAHGNIPDGSVIRHIDGNTLNCDLQNLMCISKAENGVLNTKNRYPEDIKQTIEIINKLNQKLYNLNPHTNEK
jgi:hypothetical protein